MNDVLIEHNKNILIGGMKNHFKEPFLDKNFMAEMLVYALTGHPPFYDVLIAVLSADYARLMRCSDEQYMIGRDAYKFAYNYLPSQCWKTKDHYDAWTQQGGMLRGTPTTPQLKEIMQWAMNPEAPQ